MHAGIKVFQIGQNGFMFDTNWIVKCEFDERYMINDTPKLEL